MRVFATRNARSAIPDFPRQNVKTFTVFIFQMAYSPFLFTGNVNTGNDQLSRKEAGGVVRNAEGHAQNTVAGKAKDLAAQALVRRHTVLLPRLRDRRLFRDPLHQRVVLGTAALSDVLCRLRSSWNFRISATPLRETRRIEPGAFLTSTLR